MVILECSARDLNTHFSSGSQLPLSMNTKQNTLRNTKRNVTALAAGFRIAPLKYSVLLFKHATDSLFAQSPHLCDLRHGIVPFQPECRPSDALNGLSSE